jgi:competence protein ComEA
MSQPSPANNLVSRYHDGLFVWIGGALVMVACSWWLQGGPQGELIEIDRARPLHAQFLVNLNTADGPEFLQLPGIGEMLAQRILVDRREQGPFQSPEELTRVHGIGPKTMARIRPYLLPLPQPTDPVAPQPAPSRLHP